MSGAAEKLGRLIAEQSSRQTGRAIDAKVGSTHNATVVVHDDGTKAVVLDGAEIETPVAELMNAKDGDRVSVAIRDHVAIVVGNYTRPATDDEQALLAQNAAQVAWEWADEAHTAADSAVADAADAKVAAAQAESDAAAAQQSAATAADAATEAQGSADAAADAATEAQGSAATASTAAQEAQRQASEATTAASEAKQQSAKAEQAASSAVADAGAAREAATRATGHANAALNQLGVVQDVAGILSWASEHGTFVPTPDATIQEGKVYFALDGTDYVPVVEPQASQLASYYELTVDEPMNDFIMAHLAVTSRGLWVLPSGIGQAQTEQRAPGYKMLLAADGSYLYDAQGNLVRSDTAAGTDFAASRDWHVGSEDAFIFFDASEGTITLGGDSIVIGGDKTLSELIAESEGAAADAAAAVKAANDVPIVTLSSTNGTTFKRNLGISTTIVATIFTPGGRISTASELRERFGAGAYLEWGWRDVVTDADHVLVTTDPRIIMGGFGLVVTPEDVDSQAVITCSLNY